MSRPILDDAFAHHVWATIQLIDVCGALTPAQLDATAEGTYGSIIETLRHTVGADASYLALLAEGRRSDLDESSLDLAAMRAVMESQGPKWASLLARGLDADADVVRTRDDGTRSHATAGIRLAQVVQHGTEHRSQIATVLTTLGIEPPELDVRAYGAAVGRASIEEPRGG